MKTFNSYVSKIDMKDKLNVIRQILDKAGFSVINNLSDQTEPHIYVEKPVDIDEKLEDLSFGGVRVYIRGKDIVCYRPQNKKDTEPFGQTYQLDVKNNFKELAPEHSKTVGERIIFEIIRELRDFFLNSASTERQEFDDENNMGTAIVHSSGTDYANIISNDMSWKR